MPPRPRLAWLLLPAVAAAACASEPAPWKVAPDRQERFTQAREACEVLTDTPEAFERCMERRGWRREGWLDRLF